jgi:hypothetical protein
MRVRGVRAGGRGRCAVLLGGPVLHEGVDSGSGAEAPLGERPERRVVPDVDREPGPLTQNAGDVDTPQSSTIGGDASIRESTTGAETATPTASTRARSTSPVASRSAVLRAS